MLPFLGNYLLDAAPQKGEDSASDGVAGKAVHTKELLCLLAGLSEERKEFYKKLPLGEGLEFDREWVIDRLIRFAPFRRDNKVVIPPTEGHH